MTPAEIVSLALLAIQLANQIAALAGKVLLESDLPQEERDALIARIKAAQEAVPKWE